MARRFRLNHAVFYWLPDEDLNPDKQSQSLSCYRYTIGQFLVLFYYTYYRKIVKDGIEFYAVFFARTRQNAPAVL